MDIQEIASSLEAFTPIIQYGAVTGKWHVTFADWKDDIYTGDTILLALQSASKAIAADPESGYKVEKHEDYKYWQKNYPSLPASRPTTGAVDLACTHPRFFEESGVFTCSLCYADITPSH